MINAKDCGEKQVRDPIHNEEREERGGEKWRSRTVRTKSERGKFEQTQDQNSERLTMSKNEKSQLEKATNSEQKNCHV